MQSHSKNYTDLITTPIINKQSTAFGGKCQHSSQNLGTCKAMWKHTHYIRGWPLTSADLWALRHNDPFQSSILIRVLATKANSAFHPSAVGKWVPASAGKAKAGMVHSVNGWMRGVQLKLWDPLRTCASVPYLSALEVWSRQGTIQIHVYPYLY